MQWTGNSSTRTLNINRECESMPAKNIDFTDSPDSANTILKNLRLANVNRLICAQLNINSISNKCESLKEIVSTNVDILLICETKVDSSFPRVQFHLLRRTLQICQKRKTWWNPIIHSRWYTVKTYRKQDDNRRFRLGIIWGYAPPRQGNRSSSTMS